MAGHNNTLGGDQIFVQSFVITGGLGWAENQHV